MSRAALCFILILIAGGIGQQALADEIKLKNGDRLTGKIVKSDGKSLVIKTDLAGEVTVAWPDVTTVTSNTPLFLTLVDGRIIDGLVSTSGEQLEVRRAGGSSVTTNRSEVVTLRSETEQAEYLNRLNPGLLEGWNGSADLGFALSRGNSDTTNLALGLAVSRTTPRDETTVYSAGLFSKDSTSGVSRTTANILRGGLRYERNITERVFGYGFTDLEHNDLQDLALRLVLGGGLGYRAIRSERTKLDFLGGADWNREYFQGENNNRSSAELQLGQTLSHSFNKRLSLKEQFFVFPNLTEGGDYRLNFDTALVTSITKGVGWQLTLSDRYLSNPPPGFEKNDLVLTTGLNFKIGR
jgi:putative salt-induced outer membrane protein YdiY